MIKRNSRDRKHNDQNATLVDLGIFSHKCGTLYVFKLSTKDIPFPNAFVFDKNRKQIGKVEEVFGPQDDVFVAVTLEKETDELFILSNKLIPKSRFLERSETEKKKELEDKKKNKDKKFNKNDGFSRDNKFNKNDRKGKDNKFNRDNKFNKDNKFNRDNKFNKNDRTNRGGRFRRQK